MTYPWQELDELRSELRRSEMARDRARSELSVVEERNTHLQRELAAERTELRKLRQERRMLSAPITHDPSSCQQPRQLEHPEYRKELSTSPRHTTSLPRPASAASAASARQRVASAGQPPHWSKATSLNSYIETTRPVLSDSSTQTFAPWDEDQLDWEAQAAKLRHANSRLQTALYASAFNAGGVGGGARPVWRSVGGASCSPRQCTPRAQSAHMRGKPNGPHGARPDTASPRNRHVDTVAWRPQMA